MVSDRYAKRYANKICSFSHAAEAAAAAFSAAAFVLLRTVFLALFLFLAMTPLGAAFATPLPVKFLSNCSEQNVQQK